jgi:hypothetical protein
MPQGLQVWDASGQLVLDVTDSLTRIVSITNVPAGATGSIQLPEGRPFWYTGSTYVPGSQLAGYAPAVSVNGSNLLTYSPGPLLPGAVAVDVVLITGVW